MSIKSVRTACSRNNKRKISRIHSRMNLRHPMIHCPKMSSSTEVLPLVNCNHWNHWG
jgi:hypothetical protein